MKKTFLVFVSMLLVFSQLSLGSLSVYAISNDENDIVLAIEHENEGEAPNKEDETVISDNEDEAIMQNDSDDNITSPSNNDEKDIGPQNSEDSTIQNNEDDYVTKNIDNGVAIIGYKGDKSDIVIPSEINGETVIEIGHNAFSQKQLTSVSIPSSVTTIGKYAFSSNQLTSIEIPSSVTAIGFSAFSYNQLTSIEISSSVTTIGEHVFAKNQLTSIEIPSGVTTIEWSAFADNKLASIEIPSSVTTIDGYAFLNNKLTSIDIPSSVTTIGDRAFLNNQLTSVKIPSSVTAIGMSAFSSNQLTSIDIPSSVKRLGALAFSDNKLTSIEIPSSITTIEWHTFANNQLTSVKLPTSVKTIEMGAFSRNQLTSIEIPPNVTTIGADAFLNNKLTSIEIPSNVKTIESGAFANNQLTSVVIPPSVTKMGISAFSNNKLTSVEISSNIKTIESNVFSRNQLTSVVIPPSVTTIERTAFSDNQIISLEIPSNVTKIGDAAFANNQLDFVTFHGAHELQWDKETPFDKQYKEGKTFYGWFEDKDFTIKWNNSVTQPMTIYAQWDKKNTSPEEEKENERTSYIVTFDSMGGSEVLSKEVIKDDLLQAPVVAPTKKGYIFAGWYKNTELTTAWDFTKDVVTENITLYAKWTKNNTSEGESGEATPSYKVTFNSNGGSEVPSKEVSKGELLQVPPTPVKEDHTFAGWYKDEELTTAWDFEHDVVTANEVLYAEWTKYNSSNGGSGQGSLSYIVTFNTNGGSEVPSQTVAYKASLQAPSNPMKEGFTFAGWYKDQELTKAWDFANDEVIENTTLFAKWTELSSGCNIIFNDISTNWAKEMIEEIANRCIIKGYPDGTFRPNDMIQRQHVVLMIDRALQLTPVRKAKPFTDVPTSHPYYEQITRLQRAGIVDGSNGAFRPNAYITRAQMAKILVLAFELTPGGDSSFKDVDPSHWASGYIATLADHNIALGDENGNFRPNENLTRAQFTAFMYRALGL